MVRFLCFSSVRLSLHIVVSIRSIHSLLVCLLGVRGRCLSYSLALVMQDDIQGVDYAWKMAKKAEDDVEDELGTAAALDDDCDRWNKDCENDE